MVVTYRRIVRHRGRGHRREDIEALPVNALSCRRHLGSEASAHGDETPGRKETQKERHSGISRRSVLDGREQTHNLYKRWVQKTLYATVKAPETINPCCIEMIKPRGSAY